MLNKLIQKDTFFIIFLLFYEWIPSFKFHLFHISPGNKLCRWRLFHRTGMALLPSNIDTFTRHQIFLVLNYSSIFYLDNWLVKVVFSLGQDSVRSWCKETLRPVSCVECEGIKWMVVYMCAFIQAQHMKSSQVQIHRYLQHLFMKLQELSGLNVVHLNDAQLVEEKLQMSPESLQFERLLLVNVTQRMSISRIIFIEHEQKVTRSRCLRQINTGICLPFRLYPGCKYEGNF